jgi:DNA topoisomerase-1
MRRPEELQGELNRDELQLYELIWKRTVASQMENARGHRVTIQIQGAEAVFQTSGKTIEFPGFLRAYVEGSDDPTAEIADQEVILPAITEGSAVKAQEIEPRGHETQPPARYTEASLVKKLEAEGIGRPSTYATILETIQDRGYVRKKSNALIPTFTAFAVTQLLEGHFADYVDIGFTAKMEQKLDDIADGHLDWQRHLEAFYFGNGPGEPGLEKRIESQEPEIEYPAFLLGPEPTTGAEVVVKVGRYGPYVQVETESGERRNASLPPEIAPADLTVDEALAILRSAEEGPKVLGAHPETSEDILLARGRFGPYVQLGPTPEEKGAPKPKRASLPRGMSEEEVDLATAVRLLSLPRALGHDPEGEEVVAAVGRFGPFLKRGTDTRSIPAGDDVYTVSLERALEILAQPKKGRGQRGERKVLKELGKDAEGRAIQLLDGRYGPYLTNGELNASLPKGTDPEGLTPEAAAELLATRGKAPRRGRRSAGAKKK